MNEKFTPAVDALIRRFSAIKEEFRGEISLTLAPEAVIGAVQTLRDEFQFDMLIDITSVDYWPQEEPRFHITYQLYSMSNNLLLRLRAPLIGNTPHIQTIEKLFPNANWYEREVFDLFGITFDDHSDLRRIIMPYDWAGHPLRKDYPLGYEEVQFTFNFEEISLRKPHPTKES
jgi:NADH-quinone oxidoreductase subunit C